MRFLRNVFLSVSLLFALWAPSVAHAQTSTESGFSSILSQGLIFGNICTSASAECPCRDSGNCQLTDIMQIFVNISIAILAISGSVALLMFFYGGVTWVTSMGNMKRIEEGKEIIVHAVIGLAIIFGAYAFVNFLIAAIAGKAPGSTIEETVQSTQTSSTGSNLTCAQQLEQCGQTCVVNRDSCVARCASDAACDDSCNATHDACIETCAQGLDSCAQ